MIKTNSIKVNGWLPAGLVLNGAMDDRLGLKNIRPIILPTSFSASFHFPSDDILAIENLTGRNMYSFKGKILSPALVARLGTAAQDAPLALDLDPRTAPVILLTNVLVEGELTTYTGSDVPSYNIRWSGVASSSIEISIAAAWYIPDQLAAPQAIGISTEALACMAHAGARLSAAAVAPDDVSQAVYGSEVIVPLASFVPEYHMVAGMDTKVEFISTDPEVVLDFIPSVKWVAVDPADVDPFSGNQVAGLLLVSEAQTVMLARDEESLPDIGSTVDLTSVSPVVASDVLRKSYFDKEVHNIVYTYAASKPLEPSLNL